MPNQMLISESAYMQLWAFLGHKGNAVATLAVERIDGVPDLYVTNDRGEKLRIAIKGAA